METKAKIQAKNIRAGYLASLRPAGVQKMQLFWYQPRYLNSRDGIFKLLRSPGTDSASGL
jgi:hypothetical protein